MQTETLLYREKYGGWYCWSCTKDVSCLYVSLCFYGPVTNIDLYLLSISKLQVWIFYSSKPPCFWKKVGDVPLCTGNCTTAIPRSRGEELERPLRHLLSLCRAHAKIYNSYHEMGIVTIIGTECGQDYGQVCWHCSDSHSLVDRTDQESKMLEFSHYSQE